MPPDRIIDMRKIIQFIVETSVKQCSEIRPEKLSHIKFNNLKDLQLRDLRLDNIEALQFMNLNHLENLNFSSFFGDYFQEGLNRLRNIRPLTKCLMPKLRMLDFECGSIKSIGRDLSRIKTSPYFHSVGLENDRRIDHWQDPVRHEDIGIWSKLEAKDIKFIRRLSFVQFPWDRIPQKSVEDSLKRKYESLELIGTFTDPVHYDQQE